MSDYSYCIWCSIRSITAEVGAAVLQAAVAEELAEGHCEVGPKELMNMCKVRTYLLSFTNSKDLMQKVAQWKVSLDLESKLENVTLL